MLKIIALIKRRADCSRAEFRRHYEEVHVPLALQHLDQMSGYARNHITNELVGGPAEFDCLSEFWYPDAASLQRVQSYLQSDAAEPIRRDELSFMSKAANRFFPVEEEVVVGPRHAGAAVETSKLVVLATHAPGQSPVVFLDRWRAALPAWLEAHPRPLRCVLNTVRHGGQVETSWDAIAMLWYRKDAPEPSPLPTAPSGTEHYLIVRVAECRTPLYESLSG